MGLFGRTQEMGRVQEWLEAPLAETRILSISGVGGVGKSTLLDAIWRLGSQRGAVSLRLDGRATAGMPAHFLQQLAAAWPEEGTVEAPTVVDQIAAAAETGRVLVCIDNYEALSSIETWFRTVFAPSLPSGGVLLCLASRQGLSLEWQRDPEMRALIRPIELDGLSWADSCAYIRQSGIVDPQMLHTIFRETAGLPLGLALSTAFLRRHPEAGRDQLPIVSHTISSELLRDLTSPDLNPLLDALVTVREADQHLLSAVAGVPVSTPQFHALAELSFVNVSTGGLVLHDAARSVLFSEFRRRDSARFFQYHRSAVEELVRLRARAWGPAHQAYSTMLLTLCADVCPSFTYPPLQNQATWGALPAVNPLRPGDVPVVVAMFDERRLDSGLRDPGHGELKEFVENVCRHFPEMVRVVRARDGEPLGFHISLVLCRDTLAYCPERERQLLARGLGSAFDKCVNGTLETSDTRLMAAGWTRGDSPEASVAVLLTALLVDWLLTIGDETRGLAFAYNQGAWPFFRQLGFEDLVGSEQRAQDPAGPRLFELDFRRRGLVNWVYDALSKAYPFHLSRIPEQIDDESVRSALLKMDQPEELNLSTLARRKRWSGEELQDRLLALLQGTPPPPLSSSHQRVLYATFVETPRHYKFVMERLHMSRTTYYRYLQEALRSLTAILAAAPDGGQLP